MIRHIVLVKFKPDTDVDEISRIYMGLAELTTKLPRAHDFTGGLSDSPEKFERGYKHAFVIDFDGWEDLKVYADHPDHRALSSRIVANADGGIDGLIVLDIKVDS